MRFEVSERIRTRCASEDVLRFLEDQFRKVAESSKRFGDALEVKSIEASFGSINRADTTAITVKPVDGGLLMVAEVKYRPSVAFWIILIITLFTWVFWLLPIAFYLLQKTTVKEAITDCFQRARNEFESAQSSSATPGALQLGVVEELEKLATLKAKGILTDEEFLARKKTLLDI